MAYAIMRCKKLNSMGTVAAALQHCYRERETPNADQERTPDNEHRAARSTDEAMGRLRKLLPQKRRKDAVLAVEYVMTASPEWWAKATPQQQAAFFDQAHKWLADKYGADRIVTASIHRDESTPHLSAFVVPLTQDGRLSAKEFIGSKARMSRDQTSFAKAVEHLGIARGIKGSRAKHERVKRHYGLVNRAHDQAAELGMLDRASIAVGKPSKKAREALESADSILALAHEFQARQRAIKAREKALFEQAQELRNQKALFEQQQTWAKLAQEQVQELRRELEQQRKRADKAAELAELYRAGRDQAIDELRALRGHGPTLG